MSLLRNTIVGFALLSLTSCAESPQPAPASTAVTEHTAQPNGQATAHSQSNAHSQHADDHTAANHAGDSAVSAGDEVGHRLAPGHAATEHAAEGSPRRHHGSHHENHAATDGSQHAGQHTKAIAVGDKVPDFEVTLDGRTWTLSELRKNKDITPDGTLVLTFWCSFCHSCRHVEGDLDKLAQQYQGQAGVIALDASSGETRQKVAEFAKKKGLTLPIALNASGSAADIFGINATTTTAVIDSTGTLRYLGQFRDREHTFAHDALKAVLAGKEIAIKTTRPKG
jgi:thiol-disulfide isomerase/thioredoxin